MRLLSGEKTPLCKNICCGNGCQTPFCGLRLFFAQRLSFVLIIFVGERIMIKKNVEYGAAEPSTVGLCLYYYYYFFFLAWNTLFLTVLAATVCTVRRIMKLCCLM